MSWIAVVSIGVGLGVLTAPWMATAAAEPGSMSVAMPRPLADEPAGVATKSAEADTGRFPARVIGRATETTPGTAVEAAARMPAGEFAGDSMSAGQSGVPTPQSLSQPNADAAKKPNEPSGAGPYMVQLGAYGNQKRARLGWDKLSAAAKDLLGRLPHIIVRADFGTEKGVVYRLRTGNMATRAEAKSLCGELKKREIACFVVGLADSGTASAVAPEPSAPEAGNARPAPPAKPKSDDQVTHQKHLPAGSVDGNANGVEISGLLVDRTLTKGGRDFYDAFIRYLGLDFESPYTLTVLEVAGIGRSTFVTVLIEDTPVFRSRLNPLPERIENLAQSAAATVTEILLDRQSKLKELDYF